MKVQEFVAVLKETIAIPIKTWDERLTSAQANRMLGDQRTKAKLRGFFHHMATFLMNAPTPGSMPIVGR